MKGNHDFMIKAVIFDMYEILITHYAGPLYFSEQMADDADIPSEEFRREWRSTEQERSKGTISTDAVVTQILKRHHCYSDELLEKIMSKRNSYKRNLL